MSVSESNVHILEPKDPRPIIVEDETAMSMTVDAAIHVLAPHILRLGNILGTVISNENRATFHALAPETIRELISKHANYCTVTERGQIRRRGPAPWLAPTILARPEHPNIRALKGITHSPSLRPNGTIIQTEGWDEETGIYYKPLGHVNTIEETVSLERAREYALELLEVVKDFPFEAPSHQSSWLALVLTFFARFAYNGPTPGFLFDAHTKGSGKTMLAHIAGIIGTAHKFECVPYPGNDDREMAKTLLSYVIDAEQYVIFDNIASTLGCASLDSILTSTSFGGRILSKSKSTRGPVTSIFAFTGNNVRLGGDISRRLVHIRLSPDVERPYEREDFDQPKLVEWVINNRPRLAAAALGILRGYLATDEIDLPAFGSYEEWSRIIRGSLVWVGLADPVDSQRSLMENNDQKAGALRALVLAWKAFANDEELLTAEILTKLSDKTEHTAIREALAELTGASVERLDPQRLGNALGTIRGQVVDGLRLVRKKTKRGNVWCLNTV